MRGKGIVDIVLCDCLRITPAYAGKSDCSCVVILDNKDHPRLCGEKVIEWAGNVKTAGSPPPMRGKVLTITHSLFQLRITPAYA